MLLAYMDESYSRRAMSVACVVLMDSQVVSLSRDLTELALAASWRFGDAHEAPEFHAYDLVGGRGDWLALRGQVRARASIYRKALEVVASCVERVIVHRQLPGPRHGDDSARRMHVAGVSGLVRALDGVADLLGDRCLIFADDVSYRDDLSVAFHEAAPANLLDTLHFTSSRRSRPVQAADLCAYLARRLGNRLGSLPAERSLDHWLWEAIAPKVELVQEGP